MTYSPGLLMMKLQAGNVSLLPENRPGRNMNKQHVKQQSDAKIKLIILAVIFFLFALIYVINPGFYRTMYYLSVNGDLNGTISYLRSFGPYAVLVSILLDVLVNVSGVLPSIFISTANALVFGLFWGFILSWLSEVIGVVISFLLMRLMFRDLARHLMEKNRLIRKMGTYDNWKIVALSRMIPYLPNGLVTAVCAVSDISFLHHLEGSLIGKFPSVFIEVFVGHDIVYYETNGARLLGLIIGVAVVYGLLWAWKRRR
ncbi:Uncharacterized membrane protein YdjX, TVP38/TMEM64 family, SNARE-associated domain [Dialister histaminiformans]|uniref:TVP38/TMEM64 family membrane protein n=2 Tax=Allisonella histaminiformans TaxID=209880 RepID=A0A1G5W5T1_9FIRM|nr:Uncharacterized membrane protein YdjX, TVP38/TMEM64 family, SNARE-associated domain [Allisonella histaminiformans]